MATLKATTVTGNLSYTEKLTGKKAEFSGETKHLGTARFENDIKGSKSIEIQGTAKIHGQSYFYDTLNLSGNLSVSGGASISGTLSSGDASVYSLTATGDSSFTQQVSVSGTFSGSDANFSGALSVEGTTNLYHPLQVRANSTNLSEMTFKVDDNTFQYKGNDIITAAGGNMTGQLEFKGSDLILSTTSTSSNDSGDIIWEYGNGTEKMRIWADDTYSNGQGPNFRVYNSSGTLLRSCRLLTNSNERMEGNFTFSDGYAIEFKGKTDNTFTQFQYRDSIPTGTTHAKGGANSKGFYIFTNGYDSTNDYGGLAIDNEGVTIFGAGDSTTNTGTFSWNPGAPNTGGIFRVINEDAISDGPQFIVTKYSGAFVRGNRVVTCDSNGGNGVMTYSNGTLTIS